MMQNYVILSNHNFMTCLVRQSHRLVKHVLCSSLLRVLSTGTSELDIGNIGKNIGKKHSIKSQSN